MTVFGPKYPQPLQEVVSHAERFCELLALCERRGLCPGEDAVVWMTGRREEIELVFGLAAADWSGGRVPIEETARSLRLYLRDLHEGALARLALGEVCACCEDEACLTVLEGEAETRLALGGAAAGSKRSQDTWFDPPSILRELRALAASCGVGALLSVVRSMTR